MIRLAPLWATVLVFLGTAPAHAHLVGVAFGPMYSGLFHVWVSVGPAAALVAFAALTAQHDRPIGRLAFVALPLAVLGGAGLAMILGLGEFPAWPGLVLASILGALAAVGRHMPSTVFVPIAAATGLAIGLFNGSPQTGAGLFLAGTVIGASVLVILCAAVLRRLTDLYAPVGVGCQILGGWVLAIGVISALAQTLPAPV